MENKDKNHRFQQIRARRDAIPRYAHRKADQLSELDFGDPFH